MSSLRDRINAQRKAIADQKASFLRSYRFKPGKTVVRILPGVKEQDDFYKPYGAHYIKDPRDTSKILAVVGDAEICYGKLDPVREAVGKFIHKCNERGDDATAKIAKDWLARANFVMNIKIIGGADTENAGKVVPVEFSSNMSDSILSVLDTLLEAEKDPWDPKEGFVIVVDRVGTGMNDTKYTFSMYPNAAKYPMTQADLDARVDLQSYVDSKFGTNVVKALTHLSNMLGEDVTATALGSAIAGTAALPGSAATASTTASADEDDVLGGAKIVDAEFDPLEPTVVVAPEPAAEPAKAPAAEATPAATETYEDILAGLDDL